MNKKGKNQVCTHKCVCKYAYYLTRYEETSNKKYVPTKVYVSTRAILPDRSKQVMKIRMAGNRGEIPATEGYKGN